MSNRPVLGVALVRASVVVRLHHVDQVLLVHHAELVAVVARTAAEHLVQIFSPEFKEQIKR